MSRTSKLRGSHEARWVFRIPYMQLFNELLSNDYRHISVAAKALSIRICPIFLAILNEEKFIYKNKVGFWKPIDDFDHKFDDEFIQHMITRRYQKSKESHKKYKAKVSSFIPDFFDKLPKVKATVNGQEKMVILIEDIVEQLNKP